ncbi:Cell Wall Hydrolase [compost metagenome]
MNKRFLWAIFPSVTAFTTAFLIYDALNPAKPAYGTAVTSYRELANDPVSNEKTFDKQRHCLENLHCRTLAEAVFHESRGSSVKGQLMVASVILNRRDALQWPKDVYSVVHQKRRGVCQFSYVCQLTKAEQQSRIAKEPKAWRKAIDIAYSTYYYEISDVTDATHYYNPERVKRKPKFAYVYEYKGRVGNHLFYASN